MSVRIREVWRQRQARKARINQQLAEADQRIPSQLDQRDRELWSAEQRFDLIAEPGEWGDHDGQTGS